MKYLRIVIIGFYIILVLILINLLVTFVINENFISRYNDGNYDSRDVSGLFVFNVFEPYVAYYNYGNILYHNGDFHGAIEAYERALELSPPADRERDILINLEHARRRLEEEDIVEQDEDEDEDEDEEEFVDEAQTLEEEFIERQRENTDQRQEELERRQDEHEVDFFDRGRFW
ncbi:MAG: tetratricopeptide repeat protein [Oscillospiraceae bacterium]|nr:tetratricopeptide repeat protein [Oscillospiraceae bacterium]